MKAKCKVFAVIVVFELLVISISNRLGLFPNSIANSLVAYFHCQPPHICEWILNVLLAVIFFSPVICLLFCIGKDGKHSLLVRNVTTFTGYFLIICVFSGAIATFPA